jgi:hypothetical protein
MRRGVWRRGNSETVAHSFGGFLPYCLGDNGVWTWVVGCVFDVLPFW